MGTTRAVIVLLFAWLLIGASCNGATKKPPRPQDPAYLARYRTDVALPSLLVGENKVLDGGCLETLTPQLEPAADKIEQRYQSKDQITRGFKAELAAALQAVTGRIDVDIQKAKTALESWNATIEGITLATVPVSSVRADFTNEVCVLPELEWLTRDRDVVVQALMAKRIRVESTTDVDEDVRRAFEVAAQEATGRVGGKGRLDWNNVSAEDERFAIEAKDVYYAYVPTKLTVEICPASGPKKLDLARGERAEVCGLTVSVEPLAATPDQYKLNVDRRFGQTMTLLYRYGQRKLIAMGGSRLIDARVDRPDDGGRSRVEIGVWLVGPSGGEGG